MTCSQMMTHVLKKQLTCANNLHCINYIKSNWTRENSSGSAVIGSSCCGVSAQVFKLLLVYCYVLMTSVCISSVFFFLFFFLVLFSVFFWGKLTK